MCRHQSILRALPAPACSKCSAVVPQIVECGKAVSHVYMLIWLTTSFVAKVFSPLVLRIKCIVGRLPLSPISVERLHVLLCRFPARQKCFLVGGAPRVDNAPERRGMAQELEWTSQLRGRRTKGSCCQWSERTSPVHGWPSDGDVSPVAGSLKGDTSSAQTMRATLIHRPRSANGSDRKSVV